MKKIFMTLFVTATVVLTSCGGGAKTEAKDGKEETKTEVADKKVEGSVVDQYEVLVDKTIELMKKAKSGDASAATESQALSQEMLKFAQDNQEALSKLSEADQERMQEIAQKLVNAAQ